MQLSNGLPLTPSDLFGLTPPNPDQLPLLSPDLTRFSDLICLCRANSRHSKPGGFHRFKPDDPRSVLTRSHPAASY